MWSSSLTDSLTRGKPDNQSVDVIAQTVKKVVDVDKLIFYKNLWELAKRQKVY